MLYGAAGRVRAPRFAWSVALATLPVPLTVIAGWYAVG